MQPRNANALGGLLNSLVIPISSAQLLKLPTTPIPLISSPGPGFALLLRTLVASLTFNTAPYVGSGGAGVFYDGAGRYGAAGGSPIAPSPFNSPPAGDTAWLNFQVTAVANASGGTTKYSVSGLGSVPSNVLAGLKASFANCSHSANNGVFAITANDSVSITVSNSAGVAETAPASAIVFVMNALTLVGGLGETCDLTGLLTLAEQSAVAGWTFDTWALPTSEIAGASLYLGSPASGGLVAPPSFTAGDGSLVLTIECLTIPL